MAAFEKQPGKNQENNNNGCNGRYPELVWVLPFMMVGAVLGSLAGAAIGQSLGQAMPYGPAILGMVEGMLAAGAFGWLISQRFISD